MQRVSAPVPQASSPASLGGVSPPGPMAGARTPAVPAEWRAVRGCRRNLTIGPLGLLGRSQPPGPVPEGCRRKLAGGQSAPCGRSPRSGDEIGACPGGASEKPGGRAGRVLRCPAGAGAFTRQPTGGRGVRLAPRQMSCGAPLAQGDGGAAACLRYRRRPRLRVRAASRRPCRWLGRGRPATRRRDACGTGGLRPDVRRNSR